MSKFGVVVFQCIDDVFAGGGSDFVAKFDADQRHFSSVDVVGAWRVDVA